MRRKPILLNLAAAGIIGLLTVVILKFKSIDELEFIDFLPVLFVLLIFGFKEVQLFLKYRKSITVGVDSLKNNKIWSIENIIFSNDPGNANQLLVRNDLLWFDKWKENQTDDSLMLKLVSEFELIAKNKAFKEYLRYKSIRFDLYASDLKDERILRSKTVAVNK